MSRFMSQFQFTEIADWRMRYWCPHHKIEGKYDGLYVTQKPEDHDGWL